MKYTLLSIVTLLLMQGCKNSQTEGKYTLHGQIKGITSGTVKLQRLDDATRQSITIDSTVLQNGKFQLTGPIDQPEMMSIKIEPGNWSTSLFIESGELQFQADTSGSTHYDYTAYGDSKGAILRNFSLIGSENQDIFDAFEKHPKSLAAKKMFEQLNKKYEAAGKSEEKEAIRAEMEAFGDKHKIWELHWIDSITQQHPSLVAGAYLLQRYQLFNESMPVAELDKRLQVFQSPAKESNYIKNLQGKVAVKKALLPGNQAPDFKALKRDSSDFQLSSLRGKYVLLDFWASWCVPCRQAIPHWKEAYKTYNDKGLEIVGVTNDSRWPDWFKALDQEKMPWIQVADDFPIKNSPARIATLYDIPSLPTYVLLDKEGKIIIHTTSKEEMDAQLKVVFNTL